VNSRAVRALLATAVLGLASAAHTQSQEAVTAPSSSPHPPFPFVAGERAVYDIRWGVFTPGSGSMEITRVDTVRGRSAYHMVFIIDGGIPFCHVHDTLQSWVDTARMHSLRFTQDQHECGNYRKKRYELFSERLTYKDGDKPEEASVQDPLDDASFIYFARTQKLEVGQSYSYPRYFKPESNPVTLRVLRKEPIKVPLGWFNTIVVQPIIKTKGLFSEGGKAQIWISDDSARMIVQIRTVLAGVSPLTLQLKSYQPFPAPPPRKP
jgi:hypothetical protein